MNSNEKKWLTIHRKLKQKKPKKKEQRIATPPTEAQKRELLKEVWKKSNLNPRKRT
ncbi:MAG: hypothetical protein KAI16_02510 [Candidatus Pacebacteria bacterium]|nr:hypothetical protein [Candidatus Paceibacterota bacterium]